MISERGEVGTLEGGLHLVSLELHNVPVDGLPLCLDLSLGENASLLEVGDELEDLLELRGLAGDVGGVSLSPKIAFDLYSEFGEFFLDLSPRSALCSPESHVLEEVVEAGVSEGLVSASEAPVDA